MVRKKSHIVFLTPGFAESEKDSVTIPALQVYLKTLQISLPNTVMTILSFQFPFSYEIYKWHGIKVVPLNGKNHGFKKLWIWHKAYKTLKDLHKNQPISCLHSFWIGECSFIGEKFTKKHNIKHLITAMGQDVLKPNKYIKSIYKSDSKIITLSKRHSKLLKQNFDINSLIIPWGIAKQEFPEIQEKPIDILGVGSLNEIKNYALFVKVIKKLSQKLDSLKVELIGDGHLNREIENEISEKNLQDTIKLTGKLSRKLVLDKMSKAKILLHTSCYESFGYVFLEAFFSGMHIVSFDVGIAQKSERWKICENIDDMQDSLIKLLQYENKMERKLLFNIDNTVLAYSKIYNE